MGEQGSSQAPCPTSLAPLRIFISQVAAVMYIERMKLAALILALLAAEFARCALAVQNIIAGLERPLLMVQAPNDSRMFLVEQFVGDAGRIRIVENGILRPTPFLTIQPVEWGNEQGLLGVAFHPNYSSNGYFYVYYMDRLGDTNIARYQVSADPYIANPNSRQQVLWQDDIAGNHNGGTIAFGPDGYLYIGIGDGGDGWDVWNHAQRLDVWFGKMLRIDVDGDDFPLDPMRNYAIPPGNPFTSTVGLDEIWSYGWRNPWKWRFDYRRHGGFDELLVGDVGQEQREEINYEKPNDPGLNYGWHVWEGTRDTGLGGGMGPFVFPIYEFDHGAGCSVTGGLVYRGVRLGPEYYGRYFFTDYCNGDLWTLQLDIDPETGELINSQFIDTGLDLLFGPTTMDMDHEGEMYFCKSNGAFRKIISTTPHKGVFGNVDFGDLHDDADPKWCTFEFRDAIGSGLYTLTCGMEKTGAFRLPTPNSAFKISVKKTHWLRKTLDADSTNGDVTGVVISLANGDVDGDNEINLIDYGLLAYSFGSVSGDAQWLANADLDEDGEVNLFDVAILAGNFGMVGDE